MIMTIRDQQITASVTSTTSQPVAAGATATELIASKQPTSSRNANYSGDDDDEADGVGQLVLSVDFAPPTRTKTRRRRKQRPDTKRTTTNENAHLLVATKSSSSNNGNNSNNNNCNKETEALKAISDEPAAKHSSARMSIGNQLSSSSCNSSPRNESLSGNKNEPNYNEGATNDQVNGSKGVDEHSLVSHVVEISLCIKQRQVKAQPPTNVSHDCDAYGDYELDHEHDTVHNVDGQKFARVNAESHDDDDVICDRNNTDNTSGRQQADKTGRQKRRLFYERIDRFPLRISRPLGTLQQQQETINTNGGHSQLGGLVNGSRCNSSASLMLPFANSTFDACFCFNLLNVRVASGQLLALEQVAGSHEAQPRAKLEEAERSWLRMAQLTSELRLSLLHELSRVVKPKGKIMITVFAYECLRRGADSNSETNVNDNGSDNKCKQEAAKNATITTTSKTETTSTTFDQTTARHNTTSPTTVAASANDNSIQSAGGARDSTRNQQAHEHFKQEQQTKLCLKPMTKHEQQSPDNNEDADVGLDSCCPRCRIELIARRNRQFRDYIAASRRNSESVNKRRASAAGIGSRKQSNANQTATNTTFCDTSRQQQKQVSAAEQNKPKPSSSNSKRYSFSLWRAVSSATSNLDQSAMIGGEDLVNFPRELISETARRLSRRLSQGSNSIIGRLFSTSDQKEEAKKAATSEQPAERKVVCDINVEMGQSFEAPSGLEQQQQQADNYLTTDVMRLLKDEEYTKRHRQSIAVQTFFTKSIADDDDDEADKNLGLHLSAQSIEEEAFKRGLIGGNSLNLADDRQPTGNEGGCFSFEQEELTEELTTTNDESTTSGWTAPTSNTTGEPESSSGTTGNSNNQYNPGARGGAPNPSGGYGDTTTATTATTTTSSGGAGLSGGNNSSNNNNDKSITDKSSSSLAAAATEQGSNRKQMIKLESQRRKTNEEGYAIGDVAQAFEQRLTHHCRHRRHRRHNNEQYEGWGAQPCGDYEDELAAAAAGEDHEGGHILGDRVAVNQATGCASATGTSKRFQPEECSRSLGNMNRQQHHQTSSDSNCASGPHHDYYGPETNATTSNSAIDQVGEFSSFTLATTTTPTTTSATPTTNSSTNERNNVAADKSGANKQSNNDHKLSKYYSSQLTGHTNARYGSPGAGRATDKSDDFEQHHYHYGHGRANELQQQRRAHSETEAYKAHAGGGEDNERFGMESERGAGPLEAGSGALSARARGELARNQIEPPSASTFNVNQIISSGAEPIERVEGEVDAGQSAPERLIAPDLDGSARQEATIAAPSATAANYDLLRNNTGQPLTLAAGSTGGAGSSASSCGPATAPSACDRQVNPYEATAPNHSSRASGELHPRIRQLVDNALSLNPNASSTSNATTTATTTTGTGPTTAESSSHPQNINSTANLIDASRNSARFSYQPLEGGEPQQQQHQHPSYETNLSNAHGSNQQAGVQSGNQTKDKVTGGNSSALARHQQQQWRQSNTFSSSLNSDISTSGPKDTTEKDSSRRTSTLSGISSIYQQETSIGLATPHSYTGSCSTPANSQVAPACSNMGSIPELATADQQVQAANSAGAHSDLETGGQHRPIPSGHLRRLTGASCEQSSSKYVDEVLHHQYSQQIASNDSFEIHDRVSRSTNAATTNAPPGGQRVLRGLAGLGGHNQPDMGESTNLQRVAQSFKSQLRERLSTMKPLNAFMGLNVGSNSHVNIETANRDDPTRPPEQLASTSQQTQQPSGSTGGHNQESTGNQILDTGNSAINYPDRFFSNTATSSTSSLFQRQSSSRGPSSPNTSTLRSSATNKTETPTPATLKSFFRSTSSAAFNAFASSFQQSSSSTPTATTCIAAHQQHFSTNSSQLITTHQGSISSDVFDLAPPLAQSKNQLETQGDSPTNNLSAQVSTNPSLQSSQVLTGASATSSTSNIASSPTPPAPGQQQQQQPKSPLSPISMASTRFFARIRDKFNLGTAPSSVSCSRPSSALSNSTSTSMNATTMIANPPSAGQRLVQSLSSSTNQLGRVQENSVAEVEPRSQNASGPMAPNDSRNTAAASNKQQHHSLDLNDTSSISETFNSGVTSTTTTTNNSNQKFSLGSSNEAAGETSTTSNSKDRHQLQQQQQQQQLPQHQEFVNRGFSQQHRASIASTFSVNNSVVRNPMDPFDIDYERVVSLRRPSFQRQLDEQVNQIYRMAVERKLQSSPIDMNQCEPNFDNLGADKQVSSQAIGSDLDSIIRPMSSMLYQSNQVRPPNHQPSMAQYHQQQFGSIYSQAFHLQNQPGVPGRQIGFEICHGNYFPGQQQPVPSVISENHRKWMESSQQSIESSSSSVRSLRSCWFSMPELYAIDNNDSCSQSPSAQFANPGVGGGRFEAKQPQQSGLVAGTQRQPKSTVDELLEVLSDKLLPMEPVSSQTKQIAHNSNNNQPIDWPSNELCRQVTSDGGQNWTLSDLNLTSDDIAGPKCPMSADAAGETGEHRVLNQPHVGAKAMAIQQAQVAPASASNLAKCSTLDDSICASIKSNSTKDNYPIGIGPEEVGNQGGGENCSRPTSQNSTISSNSCALSDLNSTTTTTTNSDTNNNNSNNNRSPRSASPALQLPDRAQLQSRSPVPQCTISPVGDGDAEPQAQQAGEFGEAIRPSGLFLDAGLGGKQQRAMSLVPDRVTSPMGSPSALGAMANRIAMRRRSAMGNLVPGGDVAPAAATLDLRLAGRKNRVKLTDLHPITFINDREFLNSMTSLKNASDNKLNAIFNSPVGRRLSVNAEMAQHSPFSQVKSGIKIGLTGYIYIDRNNENVDAGNERADCWPPGRSRRHQFRRPSLAPNFWRPNNMSGACAQGSGAAGDATERAAPVGGSDVYKPNDRHHLFADGTPARSRARSASCTPLSQNGARLVASSLERGSGADNDNVGAAKPTAAGSGPKFATKPNKQDNHLLATTTATSNQLLTATERRRSTLSLLERLSESSVELDNCTSIGVGKKEDVVKMADQKGDRRRKAKSSSSSSSSESDNKKDNAKGTPPAKVPPIVAKSKGKQMMVDDSSSSDDGDINKLITQYASVVDYPSTVGQQQQPLRQKDERNFQADSLSNHFGHKQMANRNLIQASNALSSAGSNAGGGRQMRSASSDPNRVIKNDMILKQLLLASNAASLTSVGGQSKYNNNGGGATNHGSNHFHSSSKLMTMMTSGLYDGGSDSAPVTQMRMHPGDYRRFSAINLYQRDEDVFVANSMKRPPMSSQIQVLNALPVLAGTLPIITPKNQANNCGALPNQLPVLPGFRSGAKSIITGNSGLNTQVNPSSQVANNSSVAANNSNSNGSSNTNMSRLISSSMVAEVDVEEQLNRLRQQEKRSLGFVNSSSTSSSPSVSQKNTIGECRSSATSSSSSPSSSAHKNRPEERLENDLLASDCDLNEVTVPSKPMIPAILQPPGQAKQTLNQLSDDLAISDQQEPQAPINLTGSSMSPLSPLSASPTPLPSSIMLLAGARSPESTIVSPAVNYPSAVSKSCEPFKQLDTIIEGRGLLLGAEQQADPTYANRLRRLSGNHPRRSSVGSNGLVSSGHKPAADEEGYCKCDLGPSRKLSAVANKFAVKQQRQSQRTDQTKSSADASSQIAAPKSVLDTMKSLARRTLNNIATISSVTSSMPAGEAAAIATTATTTDITKGPLRQNESGAQKQEQTSDSFIANRSRQQRSSSMIVGASGTSFLANAGASSAGTPDNGINNLQERTLPSELLREKVKANRRKSREKRRDRRRIKGNQQAGKGDNRAISSSENENDDYDDVGLDEELDEDGDEDEDVSHSASSTATSSVTGSPDDSSLISLDDAENYRAKNKENKMKHGRSLESSSSSLASSSSSTVSVADDLDGRLAVGEMKAGAGKADGDDVDEEECIDDDEEQVDDDEDDVDDDDDDDDEEEEDEDEEEDQPKICYKCNKRILMEPMNSERFAHTGEPLGEASDLIYPGARASDVIGSLGDRSDAEHGQVICAESTTIGDAEPRSAQTALGRNKSSFSSAGATSRGHHSRRRGSTARRSASMNSADSDLAGPNTTGGGHVNRRKNKWHIQRNLAPKLKRQRSFSANYAPEVPNPMMPPPRRFSAAPTLTCPHRNKSSSHSSSSLHHTCSIDSSESMITVIPANRDFRRSPRGSLSCHSGQGLNDGLGIGCSSSGAAGATSSPFYTHPRSPLSPRSPSRCSPGLLTPSEPTQITSICGLETTSVSPTATTTNTTVTTTSTGSIGQTAIFQAPTQQQQQQQPAHSRDQITGKQQCDETQVQNLNTTNTGTPTTTTSSSKIQVQSSLSNGEKSSCYNLTLPDSEAFELTNTTATNSCTNLNAVEPTTPTMGYKFMEQLDGDVDSSMVVENGNSFASSRFELNDFFPEDEGGMSQPQFDDDGYLEYDEEEEETGDEEGSSSNIDLSNIDPNLPIICETVNDFCARHSREELEFLVKQVGCIRISDCYFSERSSTVCMIIEVSEK